MREGGLKQNEREVAMSDVGGGGSCFVEERKRKFQTGVLGINGLCTCQLTIELAVNKT